MDSAASIPFEFRGDGRSYFRIWVVNLFLSVLTLGIYSAWAKVRSNRYFYSHLYVDGTCFEYLANPLNILLGRAIAGVLFLAYYLMPRYKPEWGMWLVPVMVLALPWIVYKSLQFRAHNSAWRNIRFLFHGSYLRALVVMGIYPIMMIAIAVLAVVAIAGGAGNADTVQFRVPWIVAMIGPLVLLVMCPVVLQAYYDYAVSNSSYGRTRLEFGSGVWSYAGFLGRLTLHAIGALILMGGLMMAVRQIGIRMEPALQLQFMTYGTALVSLVAYVVVVASYVAGTTNLLYGGIEIPGGYSFDSRVTVNGLFKLYLVNTALILASAGLYIPFAKIRMIEYRVSALDLHAIGDFDEFVFDAEGGVIAVGQEIGDMFDIGVSL